jgi:hypothetical protein
MKKILAPLAIMMMSYCGSDAQTSQISTCGTNKNKVCRLAQDKKTVSCYKTKYAENFKICKNDFGYFICCEYAGQYNSTHPQLSVITETNRDAEQYTNTVSTYLNTTIDRTVPENQSYINTEYGAQEDDYPKTGSKKACYVGNNVAANNRAPYKGCPSPQSEGPEVNKQRNLNVSNPVNIPPLTGHPVE